MKKLLLAVEITPHSPEVTLGNLTDALSKLGSCCWLSTAEISLADASGFGKSIWVYASMDDSEPYVMVPAPLDTSGDELSQELTDLLREKGVCISFRAEYPRADRYGSPNYSTDDTFAEAVVSDHGFAVSRDGMDIIAEDRGDDGGEQLWFQIAVPDAVFDVICKSDESERTGEEAHIQVEYAHTFFGGDFSGVGDFAYVPVALVEREGSVEKAFQAHTGIDPVHIIFYSQDEMYTQSGEFIEG